MMLVIVKVDGDRIARPIAPGRIMSRKGIAVPNRPILIPALTEKDLADGKFALSQGVDYIALSFVQRAADATIAREIFGAHVPLVAKIENPPPSMSSKTSSRSRMRSGRARRPRRRTLAGTSADRAAPHRSRQPRPRQAGDRRHAHAGTTVEAPSTRAEATTLTAVYQGADAVMLSAESAVGRHPTAAVAIIDRIIRAIETDRDANPSAQAAPSTAEPSPPTPAPAPPRWLDDLDCPLVVFTRSGSSAQRVSATRPKQPIHALTPSSKRPASSPS